MTGTTTTLDTVSHRFKLNLSDQLRYEQHLPFGAFPGMVYFTVASKDAAPGSIKRAYMPAVDDGSNNIVAAVDLDIKYITSPDGIAVDWVGRRVSPLLSLFLSSMF